jgi:membrane-bound metal-dependent hydrolase YbcI (DUF457 family)
MYIYARSVVREELELAGPAVQIVALVSFSKRLAWEGKAAAGLLLMVVANELLPVVFGTGARAVWDWSFTYVTLRALVIPGASLALLVSAIVRLSLSRDQGLRMRIVTILAILASSAAIYASWGYQLPLLAR